MFRNKIKEDYKWKNGQKQKKFKNTKSTNFAMLVDYI